MRSRPRWRFVPLPWRDGWCFACPERSWVRIWRWIGHPDGSWVGWVEACGEHCRPDAWDEPEEEAFARWARRQARDITPAEQAARRWALWRFRTALRAGVDESGGPRTPRP